MHKLAGFYLCWNLSILKSNITAEIPLLFKVIYFLMVYLHSEICILFHKMLWLHLPLSSVQFSHSVVSDYLRPHGLQHARPPCPSPTPGVYSNSCPLSRWCHPAIASSVVPSPPALNHCQHQDLLQWLSSLHQVAKVLEFQLQHQSLQWTHRTDLLSDRLVGSPWSPRDSQESSPTPQFKNINSSALSFLIIQLSHPCRQALTCHLPYFGWDTKAKREMGTVKEENEYKNLLTRVAIHGVTESDTSEWLNWTHSSHLGNTEPGAWREHE